MSSLNVLLFWAKQSAKALLFGGLVCSLVFLIFGNLLVSLFLGVVIAYVFLEAEVFIHSAGKKLLNFVRANAYLSFFMLLTAVVLLIFMPAKALGVLMFGFGAVQFFFIFMIGTNPSHLDEPATPIEE